MTATLLAALKRCEPCLKYAAEELGSKEDAACLKQVRAAIKKASPAPYNRLQEGELIDLDAKKEGAYWVVNINNERGALLESFQFPTLKAARNFIDWAGEGA